MSRYTITGRRFSGTLAQPTRNDTETADTDDHGLAVQLGEGMAGRGMTVWVVEDRHHGITARADFSPLRLPEGSRFRAIAEWRSDGTRTR